MEKRVANDNGNIVKIPHKMKLTEPVLKKMLEDFDAEGLLVVMSDSSGTEFASYELSSAELCRIGNILIDDWDEND
jgi:hypothetical protein